MQYKLKSALNTDNGDEEDECEISTDPTAELLGSELAYHEGSIVASCEDVSSTPENSTMNPAQQSSSQPCNSDDVSDQQSAPFCCGCTRLHKGQPCSTLFTSEYYQTIRDSCAEMARGELDCLIMGQIMALSHCDETTREDSHRHPGKQRQQVKTNYYHKGHPICWKTFTHLHGIGIA